MSGKEMQLQNSNPLAQTPDTARVIQEVQGAIIVAQHCPRNEQKAFTEIINACKRRTLAEQSMYSFPRGGATVTGPSIRLAEVIARHWGNLQYGIRELSSDGNETKYEAYCWDVQTNTRASRVFSQKHGRWTRRGGFSKVDDPRDVYEVVASSATRRLRACILEIVPGDIVDDAVVQCQKTLTGGSDVPLKDRIRKMVQKFSEVGVDESMLSQKLGHKIEVTTEIELVQMQNIYKSMSDNMSKREDWFQFDKKEEATNDLNKRFESKPVDFEPKPIDEPQAPPQEPEKPKSAKKIDPKSKLKKAASKKKVRNFAPGANA